MRSLRVTLYRTITGTFTIEVPEGQEENQVICSFLQEIPGDQFNVLTDDFMEVEEDTENGTVRRCMSLSGASAFRSID